MSASKFPLEVQIVSLNLTLPRTLIRSPGGECRSIPLQGVPQIPDDVHETICLLGDSQLTDEQMDRAGKAIEEAKQELERRILAQKQGVRLEEYFTFTSGQAHGKELGRIRSRAQLERRRKAKARVEGDSDLDLCAGRGLEI